MDEPNQHSLINDNEANYELEEVPKPQTPRLHSLFIARTDSHQEGELGVSHTIEHQKRPSLISVNEAYEQEKVPEQQEQLPKVEIIPPPSMTSQPSTTISGSTKSSTQANIIQFLIDINYLCFFSYAGYATRYGLAVVFAAPQGIGYTCMYFTLFTDFYANALGCFVMGILAECNVVLLVPNKFTRLSNLVAVGMMTGYCGCTTTFSSWQYDSMYALLTGQVGTFFLREVIGLCVSYYALVFGHDMAALIIIPIFNAILHKIRSKKQTIADMKDDKRKGISVTTVLWRVIIVLFVIANVLLTCLFIALLSSPLDPTTRLVSAAMLFCPFGCTLRYLFSLGNVKLAPKIPIFTFCANLLATIIVGFFKVTDQRYSSIYNTEGLHIFFMGVTGGFCGCLSTVSSFIEEIHTKLKDVRWRYLYLVLSLVVPCLALLVIVGSFVWTV
jgi:CrcB protein